MRMGVPRDQSVAEAILADQRPIRRRPGAPCRAIASHCAKAALLRMALSPPNEGRASSATELSEGFLLRWPDGLRAT